MFCGATLTFVVPESHTIVDKRSRYLQAIEAKSLFSPVKRILVYGDF
jgi:hypothetical protein